MSYQQFRPGGFRILPPVVKNLVIINALFFLATYAFGHAFDIDLVEYLGLHYIKSEKFMPYQFITYMFMHGGIWHIFFNMFALWMFGNALENVWGPKRFLTYYMVTGIGAALIQMLVMWIQFSPLNAELYAYSLNPSFNDFFAFVENNNLMRYVSNSDYIDEINRFIKEWQFDQNNLGYLQQSIDYLSSLSQYKIDIPTVGASGAVFGVLLAFGMLFPNALLYVYFAIPIKAKYFVIIYGAIELYMGFSNNPGDNVAHFAHLGGMIFGFFMIKYWNRQIKRGRF